MALIGQSFEEFTHEEDLQESRRIFNDLIGGKQKHLTKEKRFRRKDKNEQWARVTTNRFESGGEEKFLAIAYDINNEMHAIAQQKKLLSILDRSADVISVFDHEGKITYVNQIGKKLLDINGADALAISDIISPSYAYRLKQEIFPILKGQRNWTGQQKYSNQKTGEFIDVMTHVFVLEDTFTGSPSGYASIGRDIRAELEAEKKLRDSETLFRNITDASSAALWITDNTGSLVYISKTWTEWTGAPLDMQLGAGWMNYVASEDLEKVKTGFWQDFNNRALHHMQFCVIHADSTVRCVVCKGSPQYNDKQEFTGYIGAILDITDLVEAQKQLTVNEEMMRSMIQQSPVAIGLFETDALVIKSANPAMLSILGKDDTVIGMELTAVLPELQGQQVIEKLQEVFMSGLIFDSYDTPVILIGRSGPESRYFNIICTPIHGEGNQSKEVMVMATDFTWQHQAQISMKESE